ncbi:MAG: hypothetical protein HEEMFOPI_01699 [Holosporales bacterium]
MNVLIMIVGACVISCGSRIIRIHVPSCRSTVSRIKIIKGIYFSRMFTIIRSISTKFDFNFNPVNQNRKEITLKGIFCIYCTMRNSSQNDKRQNQRQQMPPNESAKLFKMFFLKGINFNPFCFGKVKGCKGSKQNRRIEEGESLMGRDNSGDNTKHNHNKQMSPHKKSNILKRFNHDKIRSFSHPHCTTKRVKSL